MNHSVPGYEKLYYALSRVTDLIVINVLWLICCIPIITVGAATTALYQVTYEMSEDTEGSHTVRDYFRAFRHNGKEASIVWMGSLFLLAVLSGYAYMIRQMAIPMKAGLLSVIYLFLFLLGIYQMLVYPVIALFQDEFRVKVRNAALMALSNLGRSIGMLVMLAIPVLLSALCAQETILLVVFYDLIGYSFAVYVNTRSLKKIFHKYDKR